MVRLVLFKGLQKKDVKLKDVQEVLGTAKAAAPSVLEMAREKLNHIFGFDLASKTKKKKTLPHRHLVKPGTLMWCHGPPVTGPAAAPSAPSLSR